MRRRVDKARNGGADTAPGRGTARVTPDPANGMNAFAELVMLYLDNERLLATLRRVEGGLEQTRDELARPGSDTRRGVRRLELLLRRRGVLRGRLRTNRAKAEVFLVGAGRSPHAAPSSTAERP